jgi:small neutral amino acid transporter SnatA (MarC family)
VIVGLVLGILQVALGIQAAADGIRLLGLGGGVAGG